MKKILLLLVILCFSLQSCLSESIITPNILKDTEVPSPNEGQHHYLLLVTDQWDYQKDAIGNTDGIILLTLDTNAKRIMLTSFSRDILVQRPDGVIGRITFISKNNDIETLCKTMSVHFGVDIQKYILLDMTKVANIIDYLGGVDISVTNAESKYLRRYAIPKDSTKPIMSNAGTYHFNGHSSVIYMRIRKVGNGDYGRTLRIRTVLSSLAKITMQYDTEKSFKLLDNILANINQTNLSTEELVDAVSYCLELRGANIEQLRIPDDDEHRIVNYAGMTVMNVDFEKIRERIKNFLINDFMVED